MASYSKGTWHRCNRVPESIISLWWLSLVFWVRVCLHSCGCPRTYLNLKSSACLLSSESKTMTFSPPCLYFCFTLTSTIILFWAVLCPLHLLKCPPMPYHLCNYVCLWIHVHLCTHGRKKKPPSAFLGHSLPFFSWGRVPYLDLEPIWLGCLVSKPRRAIPLPSQCWKFRWCHFARLSSGCRGLNSSSSAFATSISLCRAVSPASHITCVLYICVCGCMFVCGIWMCSYVHSPVHERSSEQLILGVFLYCSSP